MFERTLLCGLAVLSGACASAPLRTAGDGVPKAIMVAPPVTDSGAKDAGRLYAATLTRPLVEHGYYVFPSSVVSPVLSKLKIDAETPGALARLDGVFGADAILITHVSASPDAIEVSAKLVEVKSGRVLWEGAGSAQGAGPMRDLAELANAGAFEDLPRGAHHPAQR